MVCNFFLRFGYKNSDTGFIFKRTKLKFKVNSDDIEVTEEGEDRFDGKRGSIHK